MWLSNHARYDNSNAVMVVPRYICICPPSFKHWKTAKRISEYLNVTRSYGITFHRGSGLELVVYADAVYSIKDTERKVCLRWGRDMWGCGYTMGF